MKSSKSLSRSLLILCSIALAVGLGFWLARSPLAPKPQASADKTSQPDNTAASRPISTSPNLSLLPEWTANARPTERTSLLLLDLSQTPTEKNLRGAGQLGEELIPTAPANPADLTDPAQRSKQEADNRFFGNAIQQWNLHKYDDAYRLFLDHLAAFPDSPWAAESELHLVCYCQYQGRYDESQKWFEASQARSPYGLSMHAKAILRLGALSMDQGKLSTASEHFTKLRQASDTPSHSTYAAYWILRLSIMKQKQTAMRDCAQKSLGEVCAVFNKPDAAAKLRAMENTQADGLSFAEIETLAREHGLTPHAVLTSVSALPSLPLPFIAHYDSESHFVVVLKQPQNGKIELFDSRIGHRSTVDETYFNKHWSGHAILFSEPPTNPAIAALSPSTKKEIIGGCCGEPREPDDLDCETEGGGCSSCRGMPEWSVNPVNMNLTVKDTPMWWDAPYGPSINMGLTYHSQDSLVSIRPFGDKWTFNYSAFAMQDPSGTVIIMWGTAASQRFAPTVAFTNGVPAGGFPVTFNAQARHAEYGLTQTGANTFILTNPSGDTYSFDVPTSMAGASAASLLTQIKDKYDTTVIITHNGQGAVTAVSHSALPTGQNTWNMLYGANGKVAEITDPWNRSCTFTYDAQLRLIGQTDMGGAAYGYGYTTAERVRERDPLFPNFGHNTEFVERSNEMFMNVLSLPTGTYQFYTEPSDGINGSLGPDNYPHPGGNTWETYRITITDPLGAKEEYFYAALHQGWHRDKNHYKFGVPAFGSASATLSDPHTRYFYASVDGRGIITETMHQGGGVSQTFDHNDAGKPERTQDQNGRYTYYTYNSKGNVLTRREGETGEPDTILYAYTYAANGSDVLTRTRKIGSGPVVTLSTTTYDAKRDVLTETDEHNHTTTFTRNSKGQVLTVTSPRGAVSQNTYHPNGRLDKVEFKAPNQTNFTVQALFVYDDIGRISSQTNSDAIQLIHEFDDLNRLIKTTYPDATFTQSTYSCCSLISSRARDGSITQYTYDALKRPVTIVKPGGETVQYEYDPMGNVTKLRFGRGEWVAWTYDAAYRVTSKLYPDNTSLTYGYDPANGRLLWSKDAQQRQTSYDYDSQGRVISITHPNLPSQAYTYDTEGRVLTWTDGSGPTARFTTYAYDSHGRLTSVDGPLADDTLSFSYDQWGRSTAMTYNGASEAYAYDNLDRIATITNPLGSFTHSYEGDTGILTEVQYPLPGMKTTYQRLPAAEDRLLTAIIHQAPTSMGGGELARYAYTYTPSKQIATWQATQPGLPGREWSIAYDERQQVTAITEQPLAGPPASPQKVWRYQYDQSGNRVAAQENNQTRTTSYNNLNQMTGINHGGSTWLRGHVDEPANVTVNGQNARVYEDGTFESLTNVGPGAQTINVQATDTNGNTTTQNWQVNNGPASGAVPTHDIEGNLLTDGTYTYTWDARNRMTSVTKGADTWTFQYDGQNRRISESKNGSLVRQFIWNGTRVMEERIEPQISGQGLLTRRYWTGGVEMAEADIDPQANYYLHDHLGSLRVVVGDDGTNQIAAIASYDYSPWGQRSENLTHRTDQHHSPGYTGHWWHVSGLSLAVYRPYDPVTGRWPSRDPIEERGGINLYGFVGNHVINESDYLGLFFPSCSRPPERVTRGEGGSIKVRVHSCEVVVIDGHGAPNVVNEFIIPEDLKCGAFVGQHTCGNSNTNSKVPPHNQLGCPDVPGEGLSTDANANSTTEAAIKKAITKLCECCRSVNVVRIYFGMNGYGKSEGLEGFLAPMKTIREEIINCR